MSGRIQLPPDRFYWTVTPPQTGLSRRYRVGHALSSLESCIPEDIESVHAACVALTQDRMLVCAMPLTTLNAVLGDLPCPPTALGPSALPSFLASEIDQPHLVLRSINLLTGAFEPNSVRRVRTKLRRSVIGCLILTLFLLAGGFFRRAWHLSQAGRQFQAEVERLYEEVGLAPGANRQGVLLAELRTLRIRGIDSSGPVHADRILTDFLEGLPPSETLSVDSLIVNPEAIVLQARIGTMDDARSFVQAIQAPVGWSVQPPQLAAEAGAVRFTLRLVPSEQFAKGSAR